MSKLESFNCIVFLRHGIAADRDEFHGNDAHRPLTDEGKRKTRKVANGLLRQFAPDLVVTSDYRRAIETGQIVIDEAKTLKHSLSLPMRKTSFLRPDADWNSFCQWLSDSKQESSSPKCLLLVGHEPCLSRFLGCALGVSESSLVLKKAGVAVIDRTSTGGWCLVALLQPKHWEL